MHVQEFDQKMYLKVLGEKISKIRTEQKLTKVQLAFEIGTSESSIRRIENGSVNISIGMLIRISIALNVNPSELIN